MALLGLKQLNIKAFFVIMEVSSFRDKTHLCFKSDLLQIILHLKFKII